jgi:hypothetical protein
MMPRERLWRSAFNLNPPRVVKRNWRPVISKEWPGPSFATQIFGHAWILMHSESGTYASALEAEAISLKIIEKRGR